MGFSTYYNAYLEIFQSKGCPERLARQASKILSQEISNWWTKPRTQEEQAIVSAAWVYVTGAIAPV